MELFGPAPGFSAAGVGQYPESLAPVRSAGIVSSQHRPSDTVPERGQGTDDAPEVSSSIPGSKSWNVFSEHESGSNLAYNLGERGPHIAFVGTPGSLAGDGEGLTGKVATNHVRNATILSGCPRSNELPHVSEDGSHIEQAVGLPRFEDRLREAFPLDVPDAAVSEDGVGKDAAPGSGE